jgi:acetate---CoA ligase (ADP-forming)
LGLASIIYQALSEDIGFSHIISTGNEADLGAVEIARALVHDPHTDVVTLTLEAVRDGDAFAAMLEEATAAAKPVVILKSGRSALGQMMAASHTGALAGSAAVFEALCRRTGVVLVNDLDELFQFAQMFVKLRQAGKLAALAGTAPGEGVVGFSVSGGHVGLLADLGALAGLAFPELSEPTRQRLAHELGSSPDLLNPLDLTGGMVTDHSIWGRCLRIVLDDPAVAVAVPIITVAHNYDPASQDIIDVAGQSDKPVVVVWAGGSFAGQGKPLLRNSPVPIFDTPARAISAIAALDSYAMGQGRAARRLAREPLARNGFQTARRIIEDARRRGRKSLDESTSKSVLRELGLPVTREQLVHSRAEAVSAAKAIGFPVALKGQHPDILHKSEAGIIRLGLVDADAVAAAFDEIDVRMAAAAGAHDDSGVLVQEMIEGATELIMGTSLDPTFGPVVMFGLGGVYVEILEDIALAVPPFDHHEAIELMHRTRAIKLLKGARGRKAADIEQLAGLLVSLGEFAHANRDIVREIDINPLVFIDRDTDQFRAVDGLIVLATE